jgi:hypothetical protein
MFDLNQFGKEAPGVSKMVLVVFNIEVLWLCVHGEISQPSLPPMRSSSKALTMSFSAALGFAFFKQTVSFIRSEGRRSLIQNLSRPFQDLSLAPLRQNVLHEVRRSLIQNHSSSTSLALRA